MHCFLTVQSRFKWLPLFVKMGKVLAFGVMTIDEYILYIMCIARVGKTIQSSMHLLLLHAMYLFINIEFLMNNPFMPDYCTYVAYL